MVQFRTALGETIFNQKYAHEGAETWDALAETAVEDVIGVRLPKDFKDELKRLIREMKFIPGGRYLRNVGRPLKFFSNCFALKAEQDTREDWADLSWKAESCLISGGGIGIDYSVYRGRNSLLSRTGGRASGPVPKMEMTNEQGRRVMQGGDRRSAMYASLLWSHADAPEFLHAKDWETLMVPGTGMSLKQVKEIDFNWPAPLDMTNVSLNYDDAWLGLPQRESHPTFRDNVRQAMRTAEPGFSFNFGAQSKHTLRNACTEFITDDDGDVCNLGSINMANIETIEEFRLACFLGAAFLYCGTISGLVPYKKIAKVRDRNRRIGLGIMGVHEWLIQRGQRYEVTPELHKWLDAYKRGSDAGAKSAADATCLPYSKAVRAIAPTGTIGIIAGTTTGIEPVFAVAYKRRYLKAGSEWHYQYVVDSAAKDLIERYGTDPEKIESAIDLAGDVERRLKFQADVQDYVDMGISSTINLPSWGSDLNCEDRVDEMACMISAYAPRLRGVTFYPDGSRGGQPLTAVPYSEAKGMEGVEFQEHDSCKGGVCGI